MLIFRIAICLSSSSVRCLESAYLDGADTNSEPFEDPIETETPESLPDSTPPTCHVEEPEGFDTSSARSTSSDSAAPLLPDHPHTHTIPTLVPVLCRIARMVVRVPPTMSPGLSASMAEVAAMSESIFRKRFRSSYESSPSSSPPDLPSRKRYRGTSELVEDDNEDDEEIEESLDSDRVSEDEGDEGHIAKDEDPTAGEEGLAEGVEGLGMGVGSHGLDDESHGLDNEGHSVESDRLGLGEEEEVVPKGQQRAVLIVGVAVNAPLGLEYGALGRQELAVEEDHVYTPPAQTSPSPEWSSSSLPISPSPSIVPLPISSPMIPLTVPSPLASPATAETEGFLTELGAQVEM
ncbi:hypothetical protein Tco_0757544 [Tanacetum coccineum]